MRDLDLIPAEVRVARRRRATLRTSALGLAAWCAVLATLVLLLRHGQASQARALDGLEREVEALRAQAAATESLRGARDDLARRLAAQHALEAQRPVTGIVTFVAGLLPEGARLEGLDIEPEPAIAAAAGSAGYFGVPAAGALGVRLRGVARSSAEIAVFLSRLDSSHRFARVQLARVDRTADGETGGLRFEMRCER